MADADTNRGAVSRLVSSFADLPGIGRRTAERLAYHVLMMPRREAIAFADAIRAVKDDLHACRICGNLAEQDVCSICGDPKRDQTLLCVVEQVRDLLALEQAGAYRGVYHVLQGRLAPCGKERSAR
jgi:recombination protein RecR